MDDGTGEGRKTFECTLRKRETRREAYYVTTDVSSEPFGGTYISEGLPGSELREQKRS